MTAPLDRVLEQLCSGDPAVAERVFREYEPYLRMVVRRQLPKHLRAAFDSSDIVQSVWVDLLQGFRQAGWKFADETHLRAFLVRVTRNRFIDRVRQRATATDFQQALAETAATPTEEFSPSEFAQADELWERMLELCPPEHRQVLHLRRQGVPVKEIGRQTGLHPGSVRRILADLKKRLAGS
jgi:RNA polymerase sigma-70 factor (ECF subfamily)